ncbi:MAG TPA: AAA family ATPase [Steroidobacteraceae bacterium]|nr:AAA family ATPase [Steroidobacteraceae bacterium]
MYLSFFGLNEKPFAITPDPRYLYLSARHSEALAHLLYGINEAGGFVQLTGEVGTGKTTVIRSLLAQTPKNAEIALILNPRMTAPEFLLTICEELGIGVQDAATGSLKDLVDILSRYLLRAHSRGNRIVLVVDEAQNLAPEVLEQVRLLTNLETNTQKLLQIILIGQPELRELLGRNELRQLAQRITGRYHLRPLSHEETAGYVRHRLRVAGATTDIFTSHALTEVHRLSGGVPRIINVVCDRALLGAYTQDRHRVTTSTVRRSAEEVFGRRITPWWVSWSAIAASAVVLTLGAIAAWQLAPRAFAHPSVATPQAAPKAASAPEASNTGIVQRDGVAPGMLAPPGAASEIPSTSAAYAIPTSAGAASQGPTLARLLAQHAAETDPDSAFGRLFTLWGARYVTGSVDPCTQALQQGLECFVQRGSFAQLRLYNRPAILMLSDDAGMPHQVVLSALDDERAQVDLGGHHSIGILELSHYWFGDFVLLWRPDTHTSKPLSVGMRGEDVRRLRRSLEQLNGVKSAQPASDLFDEQLSELVRQFQRKHRLTVDGVAGVQTLVVLNGATADPNSPLLQVQPIHGG